MVDGLRDLSPVLLARGLSGSVGAQEYPPKTRRARGTPQVPGRRGTGQPFCVGCTFPSEPQVCFPLPHGTSHPASPPPSPLAVPSTQSELLPLGAGQASAACGLTFPLWVRDWELARSPPTAPSHTLTKSVLRHLLWDRIVRALHRDADIANLFEMRKGNEGGQFGNVAVITSRIMRRALSSSRSITDSGGRL